MKYPNCTIGEAIAYHKQGLTMAGDQWIGTDKQWNSRPKLTEIYRATEGYDDYMSEARDWGYDDEEADVIYHELNFKYST